MPTPAAVDAYCAAGACVRMTTERRSAGDTSTARRRYGHAPVSRARARRAPVLAGVLSVVALLLLAWPLAREPRLDLVSASVHVFTVWTLIIVALWWISRRLTRDGRPPRERHDG